MHSADDWKIWAVLRSSRALQPSALAECRKINSRRRIPSRRAIAGAKLHRDVLVAIRNPQWRPGYRNLAGRESTERHRRQLCVSETSSSAPPIEAQLNSAGL